MKPYSYEHERQLHHVSTSYAAALEWLERVGCWPSSDERVRELTRAAERRVARGR